MTSGGCLCGAVRYQLSANPVAVRQCWCRDCQYWAGGNATINLIVRRNSVRVEGETSGYASLAASGHHMRREFCSHCGTPLFSSAEENSEFQVVRAGSLDDPAQFPPQMVIWTASAPAWARLDDRLPHFAAQPT